MFTRFWALNVEQTAALDHIVLTYIQDAYRASYGPEPKITPAEVADYLGQHGRCPAPIQAVPRWRYKAVYESLQRLKRAGRIESSYADVRGRETRCYNPKGGL